MASSIPSITGTAAEGAPGGPNTAVIGINVLGTNLWWDPAGLNGPVNTYNLFVGATNWLTVPGGAAGGTWNYNSSGVVWNNGTRYGITVRVTDFAGNQTGQSSPGAVGVGTQFSTVTFNTTAPTSQITNLSNNGQYNFLPGFTVAGTASDYNGRDAGYLQVSQVQVALCTT